MPILYVKSFHSESAAARDPTSTVPLCRAVMPWSRIFVIMCNRPLCIATALHSDSRSPFRCKLPDRLTHSAYGGDELGTIPPTYLTPTHPVRA